MRRRSGAIRVARWAGLAALAFALVACGAAFGFRLAGPAQVKTQVGQFSFSAALSSRGAVDLFVPVADWGVRAEAFTAPLRIHAELRSLDRPALLRAAEGEADILESLEDELRMGAEHALMRALAWSLIAIAALTAAATAIWRRLRPRWALPLAVGVLALFAGSACLVSLRASFDPDAFRSPTYFGRGEEVKRLLQVASDPRARSEYGTQVASILRSLSAVLVGSSAEPSRERVLTLASDLHGNALVISPLAELFGTEPLLFAGDFGQRGGGAEARLLAPRVAALSSRVLAVSGNHDSRELMEALAEQGVEVLGSELDDRRNLRSQAVVEVEGLRVAGFPDPLEWTGEDDPPDRPITLDDLANPKLAQARALVRLVRWFDGLRPRPDVVIVHQNGLAQALAQTLHERGFEGDLVIATGHDHRQHVDRYGDIVVVDGGSVGAGGVFEAGRAAIGFARLRFAPKGQALRVVELVEVEPFSGQARASRITVDALCPGKDRCRFEPPAPGPGAGRGAP